MTGWDPILGSCALYMGCIDGKDHVSRIHEIAYPVEFKSTGTGCFIDYRKERVEGPLHEVLEYARKKYPVSFLDRIPGQEFRKK